MPVDYVDDIIRLALAEDLGLGDVTTDSLIEPAWHGKASLLVKASGVLAGIDVARRVFQMVDPEIAVTVAILDGARVKPGDVPAMVTGRYASILKSERTALNILQHLSGVATETARYVEAVKGLPARIVDTRKTSPGMRRLEKYAVRVGGGSNHRQNLGDGILIKDNHIDAMRSQGFTIKEIVARARARAHFLLKIEVEARTVAEAMEAADAGADVVMLDNMGLDDMRRAVQALKGRVLTEASGGVTIERVRAIAETGVDFISSGALTHSAKALDISLDVELA